MRSASIEKIGFFHCVEFEPPFDPIATLGKALDERIREERRIDASFSISNSLIVLPEAFNIGKYESRPLPGEPAEEFLGALRGLAAEHSVTFVTGVLEGRRNSAYFVNSKVAKLMCHKIGDDLTGFYDPCTTDPDPANPITFNNACIGALICMDSTNGDNQLVMERRKSFLRRFNSRDCYQVLCVPSRFRWEGPSLLTCLPQMPNLLYVVADGAWKRDRNDSRVVDSSLQPKIESNNGNEVALWKLPAAASLD